MTRKYTLEDVETLRGKAAISYEDAVALLDKYDGDIARALIELEKRGQLGASSKDVRGSMDAFAARVKVLWNKGLTTRIVVERKGIQLINLSVSFLLLMTLLGVYAVIAAFILTLLSGCSISIKSKEVQDAAAPTASAEAPQAAEQEAPFQTAAQQSDDYSSITIS